MSVQNLAETRKVVDSSVPDDGFTSKRPGEGGPFVVTTTDAVLVPHVSEKIYEALMSNDP